MISIEDLSKYIDPSILCEYANPQGVGGRVITDLTDEGKQIVNTCIRRALDRVKSEISFDIEINPTIISWVASLTKFYLKDTKIGLLDEFDIAMYDRTVKEIQQYDRGELIDSNIQPDYYYTCVDGGITELNL